MFRERKRKFYCPLVELLVGQRRSTLRPLKTFFLLSATRAYFIVQTFQSFFGERTLFTRCTAALNVTLGIPAPGGVRVGPTGWECFETKQTNENHRSDPHLSTAPNDLSVLSIIASVLWTGDGPDRGGDWKDRGHTRQMQKRHWSIEQSGHSIAKICRARQTIDDAHERHAASLHCACVCTGVCVLARSVPSRVVSVRTRLLGSQQGRVGPGIAQCSANVAPLRGIV